MGEDRESGDVRPDVESVVHASHRSRTVRWAGLVVVLVGAAVVAVVLSLSLAGSGDDDDPLSEFCDDAGAERVALAGSGEQRAGALERLAGSVPDDLAGLVEVASGADAGPVVGDMFVVPGDATSDVRADVAAEVFGRMAESGQAWGRVEQVLVGECALDLGEGTD